MNEVVEKSVIEKSVTEKSKVFFTDMRCGFEMSLLEKLDRLIMRAGIDKIDFKNKYVAIKIHFGEPGNLAFLRPNFSKTVADRIKRLGGKPFLTDCGTLYVGRRANALAHIEAAYENGYTPFSTGCHIIIADGLKGTDELETPVIGGKYVKTAKIGRAIMDADIFISLNHFKGHELSGFGGAIKNIGMGCGSRAGKMEMHSESKPVIDCEICTGCRLCSKYCAHDAIQFNGADGKATIDHEKCAGCGRCLGVCNFGAVEPMFDSGSKALSRKMAEYAKAVLDGRPSFHINIVNQVSPYCDCHSESDAAIIPDIGIFAGFDPVALDKACIDAVNATPAIQTSILGECGRSQGDYFTNIHPITDWREQLTYAEKLGIGKREYELISN